jgi:hypothetical protein
MTGSVRFAAAVLAVTLVARAGAQGVTGVVHDPEVRLGGSVRYSLTFENLDRIEYDPPAFPEGLEFLERSQNQQFTMVNGQAMSKVTLIYTLRAVKTGRHEIPPIEVRAVQGTFHTAPGAVTVTKAAPRAKAGTSEDPIFLETTVEPAEVYLGEPIALEAQLYLDHRFRYATSPRMTVSAYEGFRDDEVELSGQPELVERGGNRYSRLAVERRVLVPLKTGELPVLPGSLRVGVQRRQGGRRMDRSLFSGLLGPPVQQVAVEGEPRFVQVKPVPAKGRAPDDLGIVGRQLRLTVTADPETVDAGNPVHVRVTLEGRADLRGLEDVPLRFPDDFTVFETTGTHRVEWSPAGPRSVAVFESVVVPTQPGSRTLPAVEVPWFDAGQGRYSRLRQPGPTLRVTGEAPRAAAAAPARTVRGPEPAASTGAGSTLRYLREVPGELPRRRGPLHARREGWLVLGVLLLAAAVIEAEARRRESIAADGLGFRASRAAREARKALARLEGGEATREVYGELVRILREYVAARARRAAGGLRADELPSLLEELGATPERIEEGRQLLASIEECRYGNPEKGNLDRDLALGRAWIRDLEKEIR